MLSNVNLENDDQGKKLGFIKMCHFVQQEALGYDVFLN